MFSAQRRVEVEPNSPSASVSGPDVKLSSVPLETFTKLGVPPEYAYAAAAHVFIEWNGESAGFTREDGESIADASVRVPDRAVSNPYKQSVQANPINPSLSAQEAYQRLYGLVVEGSGRNAYSLLSNNCETWARNTLRSAGLEAPAVLHGGYGNDLVRLYQTTPDGQIRSAVLTWMHNHGIKDTTGL